MNQPSGHGPSVMARYRLRGPFPTLPMVTDSITDRW